MSPTVDPWRLVDGFMTAQVLAVAADIGLLRALITGGCFTDDLASGVRIPRRRLLRLLRALAALDVISHEALTDQWSLTETARDAVGSGECFEAYARLITGAYYQAWGRLGDALVTGRAGAELATGRPLWQALAEDARVADAFATMMRCNNEASVDRLFDTFDFPDEGRLVDVGAGDATFTCQLLNRSSALTAIAFESPGQVQYCRRTVERHALTDRCTCVSGDFRLSLPTGADTYVLRSVLHNWPDADALAILNACAVAMGLRGRLLVIERLAPEGGSSLDESLRDLMMLALFGSEDRAGADYKALFARAGLELVSFNHNPDGLSVLAARVTSASRPS